MTEVVIYNLVEGIFYAKLVCKQGDHITEIDARTSDAIALAVRFKCPIYTYEFILSTAGIILDEEQESALKGSDEDEEDAESVNIEELKAETDISEVPLSDLEKQLNEALDREEYERASRIRDEINRRRFIHSSSDALE